ncbi:hypothetical protein V2I01_07255 [Micromonospora sp. BRA006-A]|nr:hypothetical protein [Micromonospora sp. BRA006-A]
MHELIHAYRVRGHLMADTDPLGSRSGSTRTWTSSSTGSRCGISTASSRSTASPASSG